MNTKMGTPHHLEDAVVFEEATIYYGGDENVTCMIVPVEGKGMCYIARFESPFEAEGRASAAILAAAIVSFTTTWSSTYVGIGFDGGDGVWLQVSTSDARYFLKHYEGWSGEDTTVWFREHVTHL